jgi:hypothetical protein
MSYLNSLQHRKRPISEGDILNILRKTIDDRISKADIKKMKRVAFQSTLGGLLSPTWEIKLKSGKYYFYSSTHDSLYEVEKKIPWPKNAQGVKKRIRSLVKDKKFLPDTISDEIFVSKKITRQK